MLGILKNAVQQRQGITLTAENARALLAIIEQAQINERAAAVLLQRAMDAADAAKERP